MIIYPEVLGHTPLSSLFKDSRAGDVVVEKVVSMCKALGSTLR
jgi:hypothetical protein